MPIDYRKYPPNWKSEIRPRILNRAQHRCEFCGAANYQPHPVTGSRVVLTIAHLDHDVQHNDDSNLAALCQRCHNRYDAEYRKKNRAETIRAKQNLRDPQRMMVGLFEWIEEQNNHASHE